MGLLDGKVALITGGARGQGCAHAVASAREGADVVLVDIVDQVESISYPTSRAEDMEDAVRQVEALGRRALPVTADVRSQDQLDDAVRRGIAEFGKIDILIANAGVWSLAPFWEMTEEMWKDLIDINLYGVWRAAKAVAPHMIERQSGSIVVTSSVNGFEPWFEMAHYTASKHGVIGLMKTIALELATHGIRCNAISPGAVKSGMTNNQAAWDLFAGHENGVEEDMLDAGYAYHALKGFGWMSPDLIANAAVFLNSDLAAAVTGVVLPVDAGHLLMSGVNFNPVK